MSVSATNAQASGASTAPSVSADGRFVAFVSEAPDLVAGDTNGVFDVFVKDRQNAAVERVSVSTAGTQADRASSEPRISADGRFVAFTTSAALVPEDTNTCVPITGGAEGPCADIYIRDRLLGETTRISVATGGSQANGASFAADISAEGRYVVFASRAATLVTGDTNGVDDIFLRDRQSGTTSRLSVSSSGAQADGPSVDSVISDAGDVVLFRSSAISIDQTTEPPLCLAPATCTYAYVHLVAAQQTTRVRIDLAQSAMSSAVTHAALSGDGRTLSIVWYRVVGEGSGYALEYLSLFDRETGHETEVVPQNAGSWRTAIDQTGRLLAICGDVGLRVLDLGTSLQQQLQNIGIPHPCTDVDLAAPRYAVFATEANALVGDDTNSASDVLILDRDPDNDGASSEWETFFAFNPTDPADGAGDSDGDGIANAVEAQQGSHPHGTARRYLAEGTLSDGFMSTVLDLYNPNLTPATVNIQLLGENHIKTSLATTVAAKSSYRVTPNLSFVGGANPVQAAARAPDWVFSAIVESDQVLAVERTMTWPDATYGSHADAGVAEPRLTWYFAEGATHSGFDLFYLLQNPTATDASVIITYLLQDGRPPVTGFYTVAAHSRKTIWVDKVPTLDFADVSAKIESNQPILAERAMYLSRANELFTAGHDGSALPEPATEYFVPEGATGDFFDLYVLVGNPNNADAQLTFTYLLPDGNSFTKQYTAAAQSRLSIFVDVQDPRLAATAVAVVVNSTNGVPVVVERAMWWPSPDWYEGHLSAASTESGRRWALASGPTSRDSLQTFLLVANPTSSDANVTLDLVGPPGTIVNCATTVPVSAHSRVTLELYQVCGFNVPSIGQGVVQLAGTIVSDGPDIVVERATYRTLLAPGPAPQPPAGPFWSAGESTILTLLPDEP